VAKSTGTSDSELENDWINRHPFDYEEGNARMFVGSEKFGAVGVGWAERSKGKENHEAALPLP
jgi:hypothetical protein